MVDKKPNKRVRSKQIGKFFTLVLAPYKKDIAIIYVNELFNKKYIKHKIGEYTNSQTNKHALSIYNETKTVKDVKYLLDIEKPYRKN